MPDNQPTRTYILPAFISQPIDVGRLIIELGLIDEHLNQEALKDPSKQIFVKTSIKLANFLKINDVALGNVQARTSIMAWLEEVRLSAPVISLSFGSEAGQDFIEKLTSWFRQEIDGHCLLIIGLDPTIGVGSIVRTTNKVFDLSLKTRLKTSQDLLFTEVRRITASRPQ